MNMRVSRECPSITARASWRTTLRTRRRRPTAGRRGPSRLGRLPGTCQKWLQYAGDVDADVDDHAQERGKHVEGVGSAHEELVVGEAQPFRYQFVPPKRDEHAEHQAAGSYDRVDRGDGI